MLTLPTLRLLRSLSFALALTACGGEDAPSDKDDTGDEEKDAGPTKRDSSRPDASTPKDSGPPADRDASTGDAKLDALKGRYLMRWDALGTASSENALGTIKIRSRLSTLVVAELSVKDGKLVSKERVCTQIAAQKCENICSKPSTIVDQRTIKDFLLTRTQEREWSVAADGTVTGGYSVAQLGYDDDNFDAPPPDERSDDRVWDVDSSNEGNEGFLTKVSVTIGIGLNCTAYGTQKFATALKGKFDNTSTSAAALEIDLEGSDAKTYGFKEPACDSQAAGAKSPVDDQKAQIVRYGDELSEDEFWACPPASVFNEKMPGAEPALGT